jgi:hypothetical protein
MMRGALSDVQKYEDGRPVGPAYRARVYIFGWGVHIEGNGDTPIDACYPVKRAIQQVMRIPETIEFHAINFEHDPIIYPGRI